MLDSLSLLAVLSEPRRTDLLQMVKRLRQGTSYGADRDAGAGAHGSTPPSGASVTAAHASLAKIVCQSLLRF